MQRDVILELRYTPELAAAAAAAGAADPIAAVAAVDAAGVAVLPPIPTLQIDPTFPPVTVPSSSAPAVRAAMAEAHEAGDGAAEPEVALWKEQPETTSIIVRGQMDDTAIAELQAQTMGG